MLTTYCCVLGLAAAPLQASEVERLAGLSKSDFLEVYAAEYVRTLEVTAALVDRFDPAYADVFDAQTPVTDTERERFACVYDAMAAQGALADLARQTLATEVFVARFETDPAFDFVDLMGPALDVEIAHVTPGDTLSAAMTECGGTGLTANRTRPTRAFLTDIHDAAAERGYFD